MFVYAEVKSLLKTKIPDFDHYSSAHVQEVGRNCTGSWFIFAWWVNVLELPFLRTLDYWNTRSENNIFITGWWMAMVLAKENVRRRTAEGRTLWDD